MESTELSGAAVVSTKAGIGEVKGADFQSLREQIDEDERFRMSGMTYLPAARRERQRLMSPEFEIERARQIAALQYPLTSEVRLAPISGPVTDSAKDLLNPPRRAPFDRVGVACLAWSAIFIVLTGVLALTLK